MPGVNVAVIVGSNRRDSINRKLARALVRLADGQLAASFVQIDDLPMYNQDLESPLPASVARFKASVEHAAALLIVSPSTTARFRLFLRTPSIGVRVPTVTTPGRGKVLPLLVRRREPSALPLRNSICGTCSAISAPW